MLSLRKNMNQDKSKKKKGKTVNETIEMVFDQLEEDKCLELMTKQTAQLLEVAKLLENKKQRSSEIDEEDVAQIYSKLEDERTA
jgi:hypothetical protein